MFTISIISINSLTFQIPSNEIQENKFTSQIGFRLQPVTLYLQIMSIVKGVS